jgi:hypothetical protein
MEGWKDGRGKLEWWNGEMVKEIEWKNGRVEEEG